MTSPSTQIGAGSTSHRTACSVFPYQRQFLAQKPPIVTYRGRRREITEADCAKCIAWIEDDIYGGFCQCEPCIYDDTPNQVLTK
jgi:hypothetical protein